MIIMMMMMMMKKGKHTRANWSKIGLSKHLSLLLLAKSQRTRQSMTFSMNFVFAFERKQETFGGALN